MAAKRTGPIKRLNLSFEQYQLILDLLQNNLPESPQDDSFELFYTTLLKVKKAPTYQTASRKGKHGQWVVKEPP